MARSQDQFLQNLLRNITDYYTATYSTDTDLYSLLQMYSTEFSSGSIALDIVRDNTFIVTCEESQLFPNFGTFFNIEKVADQSSFEDRYLDYTSGSTRTVTPTVLQYLEETIIPGTWTKQPTWPFTTTLPGTTLLGTTQQESVYWSGSLYSTCFMGIPPASGSFGFIQLTKFTPTLGWEIARIFTDWPSDAGTTMPFGLTSYIPYRGNGIYDLYEYMSYFWISQTTLTTQPPHFPAFEPRAETDRLGIYIFPPTYQDLGSSYFAHTITNSGQAVSSNIWVGPQSKTSTTKGIRFNDKIYVGAAFRPFGEWTFNSNRTTLYNLPIYPQYATDTERTYPYLLEFDPITNTVLSAGLTAQTTLSAHVSSGSYGIAPKQSPSLAFPDWAVNAIATHGNRIYLDITSGSISTEPFSARRHQLPAFNGVDWSLNLTVPSGSHAVDMISYKDHLYATVKDDVAPKYRIAKFIHGLPTLTDTKGHWKFESTLEDSSSNSNDLTANNFTIHDYTRGRTGPGITSMDTLNIGTGTTRGASIPTASATDFEFGQQDFVVEAIVKMNKGGPTTTVGIVSKWDSAASEGYSVGITGSTFPNDAGKIFVRLGEQGGADLTKTGVKQINDDKWHYIAVTFDFIGSTSDGTIYIDGVVDSTFTLNFINIANILTTATDLEIGITSSGSPFRGYIDEICISETLLTEGDIISRNYQVKHQDGAWSTEKVFTQPLNSFFIHNENLTVSTSSGDLYYLNSINDIWTFNQTAPTDNTPIISFVTSGSTIWGMGDDHWQEGTDLFLTTPYEYFHSGAENTQVGIQPTVIPAYQKQLDFLFKGAMQGSTVEGIKSAVEGLTLISPDIREVAPLASWQLKTISGSAAQISENIWQFNDYYTHNLLLLPETEGRWTFDKTLKDSSGNEHTLTASVDPTYVDGFVELSGSASAILGDRLTFNATLVAVHATDFNMSATDDFTIEVIAKFDNPGDELSAYNLCTKGFTGPGWKLIVDNKPTATGGVRLQMGDVAFNDISVSTATLVNDDEWHYIVCSISRTNDVANIYIDGVLDANSPISITSITGSLSNSEDLLTSKLDGSIDEICITKRALTTSEVTQRHISIQTAHNNLRKGKKVRPLIWDGAHANFTSGSAATGGKVAAGYLITTTSGNRQVTVAPIYDSDLLWDLRRTVFS